MAVHNLNEQFSHAFQLTNLSPRQERLCMQSMVGFVIGVNQGWQSFEVATPFGTGLYNSKQFFVASTIVMLGGVVL